MNRRLRRWSSFIRFGLRLSDRFWRETLETSEAQRAFIREHGNFLGSVKIERWRSHTVLTVTELLPQSKSASWETRTFDIFPEAANDRQFVTLWEMPLAEAKAAAATGRVPTIELRWNDAMLQLCAVNDLRAAGAEDVIAFAPEERVLLSVPLDPARLEQFRAAHEADSDSEDGSGGNGAGESVSGNGVHSNGHQFTSFYGADDDAAGIEWHLCLRDLARRSDWDRWKIVETLPMTKVS